MDTGRSLNHSVWDCEYHIVFIPKCRRKTLCAELRRHSDEVARHLALQKGSESLEGHLMPDHVHMMIAIPPKHAVSQVVGYRVQGRRRCQSRKVPARLRHFEVLRRAVLVAILQSGQSPHGKEQGRYLDEAQTLEALAGRGGKGSLTPP